MNSSRPLNSIEVNSSRDFVTTQPDDVARQNLAGRLFHLHCFRLCLTRLARRCLFGMVLFSIFVSLTSVCEKVVQAQEVTFSKPNPTNSIFVSADKITQWQQGSFEVLHLVGNVQIGQQNQQASSDQAILWVETPSSQLFDPQKPAFDSPTNDPNQPRTYKVIAYLEGQAQVEIQRPGQPADQIVDQVWLGRFYTQRTVELRSDAIPLNNQVKPPIFARAQHALEFGTQSTVTPAQFQQPIQDNAPIAIPADPSIEWTGRAQNSPADSNNTSGLPAARVAQSVVSPQTGIVQDLNPADTPQFITPVTQPTQDAAPLQGPTGAPAANGPVRRSVPTTGVTFMPRDSKVELNIQRDPNPNNPNEQIWRVPGGVRVQIDSPEINNQPQFRGDDSSELTLLADNVVAWESTLADGSKRWEIYLEGNVVFAKGSRVIYANRMYYDANFKRGTILEAEVLTAVPNYEGLVRLKADVVQQVDENNLQAYGSAFTTSRLGVPRYWLQSQAVGLQNRPRVATDPTTGAAIFDPRTGTAKVEDEYFVESQSNRVYLAGLPVFAWPRLATTLDDPSLYIKRFRFGNDQIFGTQIFTGWDLHQVLGIEAPRGVEWIGLVDYLSNRGLAVGSDFNYTLPSLFGIQGPVTGRYRSWFIRDDGVDFLGRGRANLEPEEDTRGRIWAQHEHRFAPGFRLRAELGFITDRNFLEQFYEREWDTGKDATTGLWLERNIGSQSFNLTANIQVNDFFTQTSWLPKFDHFVLGQSLLNDQLVWHSHSHAGYGRLRASEPPLNASELAIFDPLAWEADVDGIRAGTRQELDLPTQVGPVKVIPYVLADATYWQEDLLGDDLFRVYGQAGVRASLSAWRIDPTIQSTLWNVNGLAHKVTFDVDAFYADSSQNLDLLPLYDQLDDDAQEDFRRRFAFDTFGILPGGNTPLEFDERFFAVRSGIQGSVTGPVEIAEDQTSIKLGVRQRWQTKRGLPGQERIIDWITLDSEVILFPDGSQDNFGPDLGMFDYDLRWHIGDRFSFVSDGFFDFFGQGLRTASFGVNLSRPEIGDLFVGYRLIEGPISSNIVSALLSYRLSDKWGLRAGSQIDFGETGTIGNSLSMIYIGESFLWQFGLNFDASRNNLGFRFGFEPRFTNRPRLFRPGGVAVPPAGSRWLE